MLSGENINSIERELANTINGSASHNDTEVFSLPTYKKNVAQRIETRNLGCTGGTTMPDRLLEALETLSGELNLKIPIHS